MAKKTTTRKKSAVSAPAQKKTAVKKASARKAAPRKAATKKATKKTQSNADELPPSARGILATDYERIKEKQRARQAEFSRSGRDIGELPKVKNPRRKKKCCRSFRLFAELYFPDVFTLGWSDDHLRVIEKVERVVLKGELVAIAMPRGSGKTSIAETAALWASLYGHRQFVAIIGSDQSSALEILDSLKTELETNERLAEDFPEVCYPVAKLEGIAQRANGQTFNGQRTAIGWTSETIILPTIPDSQASGAIIKTAGITGRVRGMKHKRADGKSARPDLAIIDDPQTDESARSASQTAQREKILCGAILGLAGPGKRISGIMPCTVIQQGDLADRCLDRELHPEWQGERTKLLYGEAENPKQWEAYQKILAEGQSAGRGQADANAYYLEHRKELDAGLQAAWPERMDSEDVSAIQHAMNIRLRDEAAFLAEYQNAPPRQEESDLAQVVASEVMQRTTGLKVRIVPQECQTLTAFVDVQGNSLWYVVAAWRGDAIGGSIIDYGVWPEQNKDYVSVSSLPRTLQDHYRIPTTEAAIYAGATDLLDNILEREYEREDGTPLRINFCMIDANWGESTDTVYQICRRSKHASILMPSHGRGIGPNQNPMSEYKKKPGDRFGSDWFMYSRGSRKQRHLLYDTNAWKTRLVERITAPAGDPTALMLFGNVAGSHRMIADHLTSEFSVKTEGRGRTVHVWQIRPGISDNHLLDCTIGCLVGASVLGIGTSKPAYVPIKHTKPTRTESPSRRGGWLDTYGDF